MLLSQQSRQEVYRVPLLARYFGRHIPGEPAIVPQQMTGAGSLRAANYIFSVAAKDGAVIIQVSGVGKFVTDYLEK